MNSSKRSEALLNEYKGNLYEFLVAHHLARALSVEASFMRSITPDFYSMLAQQESFIREYYPKLLIDLPKLAEGLSLELASKIRESKEKVCGIELVGKAAAGMGAEAYGEGDFLVIMEGASPWPISVKLSKAQAYVNTKSAGVKSFLSKYFGAHKSCSRLQEELNEFFDREFDSMAFALHDLAGIDYDQGFENWKNSGLSQLPGELDPQMRKVFLGFLYKVSNKLFESLDIFHAQEPSQFIQSLDPLIGYSRKDIIQASTFYRASADGYELFGHSIENANALEGAKLEQLVNREETSSFDIEFTDRTLQIRLKAMNRFTGKGFKVNCAVKAKG